MLYLTNVLIKKFSLDPSEGNSKESTYTREDIVPIRRKIAIKINPTQTSERKEIFANRAMFL